MTLAAAEITPALERAWAALERPPAPPTAPPIQWRPAATPLFPLTWPPAGPGVWVRYSYAYGQDPALADGARVAEPWARLEFPAAEAGARLVVLSSRLEPAGVQGVRPLDAGALSRLAAGGAVEAWLKALAGPPAEAAPETAAARAYYQLWRSLHGVIAGRVRPAHAAFCDWWTGADLRA